MHNSSRDAKPATTSTWAVVQTYVRERFSRHAWRWVGIIAFVTGVQGAFRLRDWGASWESFGMIGLAFAIAAVGAVLVVAASLAVGGVLHAHGFEFPEWLTRRRGE